MEYDFSFFLLEFGNVNVIGHAACLERGYQQIAFLRGFDAIINGFEYVSRLAALYASTDILIAIGLQYRFRSLQWLSTIPPILFIVAFKIYIDRVHLPAFQYYIPTEEEIKVARVHSERADARGNRLERRFGHPALQTDLFTPMLHAKMMPLLSQVYHGNLGKEEAKLKEYGGQKMEAQIVPGGIKIAAVSQVCSLNCYPLMLRLCPAILE